MKVTFLSDTLQKKLGFVNHAIAGRSSLPVLLNLLLHAKGNMLSISATDLEIGIEIQCPVTVLEEGEITIPAKIFLELISSIGTDTITIETKDKSLHVSSIKTKASLQTIDAAEFPKLYEEKGEERIVVKKEDLEKSLAMVVFATAIDVVRPALSGVLLKPQGNDDGFLLVATDGYRLSLKTHALQAGKKEKNKEEKAILIPARVVRESIAMKSEGEELRVYISEKSNQALFEQDEVLLVGRLIEAEYPNYERIIPSDFTTRVLFDREELQKAVKICSIFARETANIIKFTVKKDAITVSANAQSVGENSVDIEAQVSGEENEIAFNGRYLLDLLANTDAETMVFEMTGPLNPGVFKIKDDVSFLHIIMPIRVQG